VDPLTTTPKPTIFRLCNAILSLKRRERALCDFLGTDEASLDEVSILEDAILDLCGIPEDNSATRLGEDDCVCRDMWRDEMEEFLAPKATQRDFERMIARMKELKQVESITFSPTGRKLESRRKEH
jgi:hypothetical protein